MFPSLDQKSRSLRFATLAFSMWSLSAVLPAQEEPPKDPVELMARIDKDLTTLEEALNAKPANADEKKKAEEDTLRLLDALAACFDKQDDKQKGRLRKLIDEALDQRSLPVVKKAVESLSRLAGGEDEKESAASTKTLVKRIGLKSFADELELHLAAIAAVGKLAHKTGVEPLGDRLADKETKVVVAAIDALKNYDKAPTSQRKEIFQRILRALPAERTAGGGGAGGRSGGRPSPRPTVDPSFNDERAKAIRESADRCLQALTKQSTLRGAEAWGRWWNKEGKKAASW